MQEGWQLLYFCLKQGCLQEPAGKGNKHSLSAAAPKNKATTDLAALKRPVTSNCNPPARLGSAPQSCAAQTQTLTGSLQ